MDTQIDFDYDIKTCTLENIFAQIDNLLSDTPSFPQKKSRQILTALFHNNDFLTTFLSQPPIAYFNIIIQIYEKELQAGESFTILDMGTSHDELISKLTELKFILWRIEFAKDADAFHLLLEFIQNSHATPYMLQYLIQTASLKQDEILFKLTDLFLEKHMFRYAFHMLDYLTQLFPEDETVLCLAADFCGGTGNRKQMNAYLSRIKNPGEPTERIRTKYGC